MIRRSYTLTLTLKGPLLSQASGTLAFGYDAAMLRDGDGKPALGGSLIRGNLRETLLHVFVCELRRNHYPKSDTLEADLLRWFGQASRNDESTDGFEPQTGTVQFDFLWRLQGDERSAGDQYRTRISIDESGKVERGALQVIEDCFPLGSEPVFSGTVQASFKSEAEAQRFERLMRMALDYIPALGSLKGIGFGKLLAAVMEPEPALKQHGAVCIRGDGSGDEVCLGIEFTPDRPFCLGKPRTPDSNRIVSEEIIPGNVIKALLAKALGDPPTLDALRFDQWRVAHCLPVKEEQEGRKHGVIPLSIAKLKDKTFSDLSGLSLVEVATQDWPEAPAFQIDWKDKDWEQINTLLEMDGNKPQRRLQVRTAIESRTQTAAEGKLFSMECVVPDGFVWRGMMDLSAIPAAERKSIWQALEKVLNQGLSGLGKTKAALTNCRVFSVEPQADKPIGEQVTLTLLTPARLFPLGWERATPNHSAMTLYAAYWEQVSEGSLQFLHGFAQQERQGGAYHYHHFQKRQNRSEYAPEWLSTAGSVFVLKVLNATRAKSLLQQWQQQGLPVPEGAAVTWEHSPYLPEHGFGEIALDWHPVNVYPGVTVYSEQEAGQ